MSREYKAESDACLKQGLKMDRIAWHEDKELILWQGS